MTVTLARLRKIGGEEMIKRRVGLKEFLDMMLTASDKELKSVELTDEGKQQLKRGIINLNRAFSKVGSTFAEVAGALKQIGDILKRERRERGWIKLGLK